MQTDPVVASKGRSTTLSRISLIFIVAAFFARVLVILPEWLSICGRSKSCRDRSLSLSINLSYSQRVRVEKDAPKFIRGGAD
jgi:hypothetical protein